MTGDLKRLVDKAQRSLRLAQRLVEEGEDFDFAASRAYHAMFYMAEALLRTKGVRSFKHSGVIAGFYEHFIKSGLLRREFHEMLYDAFEGRQIGDYGFEKDFPRKEAASIVGNALRFLEATRPLLSKKSG